MNNQRRARVFERPPGSGEPGAEAAGDRYGSAPWTNSSEVLTSKSPTCPRRSGIWPAGPRRCRNSVYLLADLTPEPVAGPSMEELKALPCASRCAMPMLQAKPGGSISSQLECASRRRSLSSSQNRHPLARASPKAMDALRESVGWRGSAERPLDSNTRTRATTCSSTVLIRCAAM